MHKPSLQPCLAYKFLDSIATSVNEWTHGLVDSFILGSRDVQGVHRGQPHRFGFALGLRD
jgi:hypothetical protein